MADQLHLQLATSSLPPRDAPAKSSMKAGSTLSAGTRAQCLIPHSSASSLQMGKDETMG